MLDERRRPFSNPTPFDRRLRTGKKRVRRGRALGYPVVIKSVAVAGDAGLVSS